MNGDDFDDSNELQRLYRGIARERTSAATDATILLAAREQASRDRWRKRYVGIALAAAAMLILVVTQISQRRQVDAESVRARYAAITWPYRIDHDLLNHDLLDHEADESPFARATRYLFDRRELEQPSQSSGDVSVDWQPQGI